MLLSNERMLEIRRVAADIDDPDARRDREARAMRDLLAEVERLREAVPYTEGDLMALVQSIRRLACPEIVNEPPAHQGPRLRDWLKEIGATAYANGDGELETRLRRAFLEGFKFRKTTLDARIGQAVTEWREARKR